MLYFASTNYPRRKTSLHTKNDCLKSFHVCCIASKPVVLHASLVFSSDSTQSPVHLSSNFNSSSEARFLNSEELSRIKPSPLPPQLPLAGGELTRLNSSVPWTVQKSRLWEVVCVGISQTLRKDDSCNEWIIYLWWKAHWAHSSVSYIAATPIHIYIMGGGVVGLIVQAKGPI